MNPLQSKIEQTAKEYLTYKAIADKSAEQAKKEKENIGEKVVNMDDNEMYGYYFDTFVALELLIKDMIQLKTKLYNQIELAKDTVEIPKEILDLVSDYNQPLMFAIIGDEKKLLEKETYDKYKTDYISGSIQIAKFNAK